MKSEKAYMDLVAEARRVGWPVMFQDDLHVHDREELLRAKPACFGWVLHECGTDLILPGQPDAAEGILRFHERCPGGARFYLWDGALGEVKSPAEIRFHMHPLGAAA